MGWPMFVYKLIVAGSIEEKILEMQARKAALAAGLLSEDDGAGAKFSAEDIETLLAPIPDDDASARPKRRAVKQLNDTD